MFIKPIRIEVCLLLQELDAALERQKYAILNDAEYFLNHPELACAEQMTSEYIMEKMLEHGLSPKRAAGTGIFADIGTGDVRMGLIADMDGIEVNGRISHACGHHAQLTHLLGVMRVLTSVQALGYRFGVRLIAAPAEELTNSRQRDVLLEQNDITSRSGKMCLYQEGVFEPLQALVCCHLADDLPEQTVILGYRTSGCVALTLKLENTGISKDTQKLVQIIQKAAGVRNILVRLDMSGIADGFMVVFFYGEDERTFQVVKAVANTVVQQIHSIFSSQSIKVLDVCDAYAPICQNPVFSKLIADSAAEVGFLTRHVDYRLQGFTDLGFLSKKLAVCHPLVGGTKGITHTNEFHIVDPVAAYILPIRMLLHMIARYFNSGQREKTL